jgi:ATP/maltotriose-dependent transcriptional regulator MalT
VIDNLHELSSPEARAQLERLIARRPPQLRVVLATRGRAGYPPRPAAT